VLAIPSAPNAAARSVVLEVFAGHSLLSLGIVKLSTEAVLGVVEGDPLDEASENFLG
jgi:hypothetical protein